MFLSHNPLYCFSKGVVLLPILTVIHNYPRAYFNVFILNFASNLRKLQPQDRRHNFHLLWPTHQTATLYGKPVLSTSNNSKPTQVKCLQHVGEFFG
jgi:hypothetical protein